MDLDFALEHLPRLLKATKLTIELTIFSLFFGIFVGVFFAVLRTSKNKILFFIADLKFDFLPAHLAEYMPGNFPKISISRPESSARQTALVFLEKYLALINEFSKNEEPVSFGFLILRFFDVSKITCLDNKFLISLTFP